MYTDYAATWHLKICHVENPDYTILWTEKCYAILQKWNLGCSVTGVYTAYSLFSEPRITGL